jgi:hypothetical protein
MNRMRKALLGFAAALIAAGTLHPASASTFVRAGLDDLVAENETIVVGEVLSSRSYWNEAGTFILTDVRVGVSEVLKGSVENREITVTVPGGRVGDLVSVIVGGADLAQGKWYVLFLDRVDMLGVRDALAVHDHCQGAFDVEVAADGLRAISQARRHGLMPDAAGNAEPVGGAKGIPFTTLIQTVRELATQDRNSRQEVK